MKIVCISDTHNCNGQIEVPDGDLLIHAGDATVNGTKREVEEFTAWFGAMPHGVKIFVAGNHDWLFEKENAEARAMMAEAGIVYLQDSSVEIDGLKIYGSPWQPRFFDWAFNLNRGPEIAGKWALIPDDIDILITHGPPHGIRDLVPNNFGASHEGCEELRKRVEDIAAAGRLKLHIFGHIHCGHGIEASVGIRFVNASVCDEDYRPTQPPRAVDLPD